MIPDHMGVPTIKSLPFRNALETASRFSISARPAIGDWPYPGRYLDDTGQHRRKEFARLKKLGSGYASGFHTKSSCVASHRTGR